VWGPRRLTALWVFTAVKGVGFYKPESLMRQGKGKEREQEEEEEKYSSSIFVP
jgi:hypothetical protein